MLNTIVVATALVAPGDRLCWPAPMPSAVHPRMLVVTVRLPRRSASGAPAAWVEADSIPSMQWLVPTADLRPLADCQAATSE